ncbi:MAG: leucyl aminopeptidase family protein [Xanthomonadaceae bacterium]|nr:leucyl aminopeptidase family protein [Xanthomonadaceae bacterium]
MHGLISASRRVIDLIPVDTASLQKTARRVDGNAHHWVEASGFRADPGTFCPLPDTKGQLRAVLVGVAQGNDVHALSALPNALPVGDFRLTGMGLELDPLRAALGWGLGAYRFARYRKAARTPANLLVDVGTLGRVVPLLDGIARVRDLVNTPTQDLGPAELTAEVAALARRHRAKFREWAGVALLKANFPTIHAVGRGSHREPRLAELTWGDARAPHLVLVGKGVCFDTGGLDLKTSDGMRWMKKDMGGAAHAIALADLVMRAKLPVRLTVLIPAVENAVSGEAYRPGEVIRTRAGVTVEVDNTDAEGRLILCDALAYAVEKKPDLILDFATLTGAARVALGPELPALFANRDDLAQAALDAGEREADPLWRLPLWRPYARLLESSIADIANAGPSRHAGAITAALYLQHFVPDAQAWMHVDVYAWNDTDRPGRPKGGEAQGLRAVFAMLKERYK